MPFFSIFIFQYENNPKQYNKIGVSIVNFVEYLGAFVLKKSPAEFLMLYHTKSAGHSSAHKKCTPNVLKTYKDKTL